MLRFSVEFRFDSFQQLFKVSIDDLPNQLQVEAGITVCRDVSKTEDLAPLNSWMALTQRVRQMVPRRVGNCLKPPGHHVLIDLIAQELIQSSRLVAADAKDAVAYVSKVSVFAISQWARSRTLLPPPLGFHRRR